jgi:hypothetical protein
VADSAQRPPDRPDDRTWDDVEQGFFASAPPDVPEPPLEPARFDDLVSDEPQRPDPLAAARRALTTAVVATRRSSVHVLASVRRRATPVMARAVPALKRAVPVLKRAVPVLARAVPVLARARRAAAMRFAATRRIRSVLWSWRPDRRSLVIALTIAVVVGFSGGVIAARGGHPDVRTYAAASAAPPPSLPAVQPTAPLVQPTAPAREPLVEPAVQATAPASEPLVERAVKQAEDAKHPPRRQRRSVRRYSARTDLIVPTFVSSAPPAAGSARR